MKKLLLVAMLSTILVVPISAGAVVTYNMSLSNVLTPDLYGTATITGLSSTMVQFNINLDETKLNPVSNYGIDKFFFNTNLFPTSPAEHWLFGGLDTATWDIQNYNSGAGGFGTFSIQYKGTGNARVEPLIFTLQYFDVVTGTGTKSDPYTASGSAANISESNFDIANSGGFHLLVHVGGIDVQGQGSAYLTDGPYTPVPEPGTMLLLGSGLVGFAGWGRKKFRK